MRVASIVLALFAVMGCATQDVTVATSVQTCKTNSTPIEVKLLPPSPPATAGTRAVFTFRITNVSAEPVNLPWPGFIDRFICTTVKGPNGFRGQLEGKSLRLGHGKYPGGDIQPGKSIEIELSGILTVAGEYTVSSSLTTSRSGTPWWTFWEGRADAPDIAVTVLEKEDNNDLQLTK